MTTVSVCYVLSYHILDHARSRTLVGALQRTKAVKLYQARNTTSGPLRYIQTLGQLIRIRVAKHPDYYVLGFRGVELFWLVRLITLGKPLIFDHMMSPYDSMVNELHLFRKTGIIGRLIYLYERSMLRCCRVVLTDTDLHKKYFQDLFLLAPEKVLAIPVGADEKLFHPVTRLAPQADQNLPFEVFFYGSFVPLHGVDVILRAASILRDSNIHFTLVGGFKVNLSAFHRMIKDLVLHNVAHVEWVPFEQLPQWMARSDVGLGGPFGNTAQARRVITGKTFQFLAMAIPAIVGEVDLESGFVDRVNCLLVPQGDEKALAAAILWAVHHKAQLEQIGQRGYDLYRSRYSIQHVSNSLERIFSS